MTELDRTKSIRGTPLHRQIRQLQAHDLDTLTALCAELGYSASALEIAQRFEFLHDSPQDGLFAAVNADERVVGFVHVRDSTTLHLPPSAELLALVVSAAERRTGCGRALVAEAERWARTRRRTLLYLRSREERADAHRFYEDLGFERGALSRKFTKTL
jgi:GNAT superfamily N-acetyltransferase